MEIGALQYNFYPTYCTYLLTTQVSQDRLNLIQSTVENFGTNLT